jgi:hypothetical protein
MSSEAAIKPVDTPTDPAVEQDLAWLGDAVLALWAREKILREQGHLNTERFLQLSSNHFLQSVGRPTKVEAEFGVVYQSEGLEAAFQYIEARLIPVFLRQEARRIRERRS